jgi:hypothetical protein
MRRILCILILIALSATLAAQGADNPWEFRIIFDQMMMIRIGFEYHFDDDWSLRSSLGMSPFGIGTAAGDLVFLYNLRDPSLGFQADLYAGMPFFYFNFIEGRLVDWDDIIEDPFWGIGPGGGIFWSYQAERFRYGINTGLTAWMEWQRGVPKGPRLMPHISLELIL